MVLDWLRQDLGGPAERCLVRVDRVRRGRVEVSHELGFAWVWPRELAPTLTFWRPVPWACCDGSGPSEPYPSWG